MYRGCAWQRKLAFVSTNFIYGLPGETYLDRLNCVKLSRSLGLDIVRYNNATPYPGTELYEIAKQEKGYMFKGCMKILSLFLP